MSDFNYYVNFYSSGTFDQMKLTGSDDINEVKMSCMDKSYDEDELPEIIFTMETPENFTAGQAQFSIKKREAELIINVLRSHFKL